MKALKLSLITGLLSVVMTFPVLAGTWTHTKEYSTGITKTYEYLWFYIKDDGTYAQSEWIQDADGTWYWITNSGALPIVGGVADDGYLFNSAGCYVPMDGRFFLTAEGAASVSEGMSYEQVISMLGFEHDRSEQSQVTDMGIINYTICYWFEAENNGNLGVRFDNGMVTAVSRVGD